MAPSRLVTHLAALSIAMTACSGATPQAASTPGEETDGTTTASSRAEPISLSADGISFEGGSDALRESSSPALDGLALAIGKGDDGGVARVRVTMDPDPHACSGEPLARQRAKAIREALVARGVGPQRVEFEGISAPSPGCEPVLASRSSVTIELVDQ
jgi:outer membrane protein OmpA-like peptidoglycan-associated protein